MKITGIIAKVFNAYRKLFKFGEKGETHWSIKKVSQYEVKQYEFPTVYQNSNFIIKNTVTFVHGNIFYFLKPHICRYVFTLFINFIRIYFICRYQQMFRDVKPVSVKL